MIKILIVPTDKWACDLYRCSGPHKKLQEMYPDEFQCDIKYNFDFNNIKEILKYDAIQLHGGLYREHESIINMLKQIKGKITIILDLDDYWELPENHEAYETLIKYNWKSKNLELILYADYITCTQDYFKQILLQYHPNVITIPNAIDSHFPYFKIPSNRIRFGFTGSRSHYHDYEQFKGVVKSLPKQILDKCQFVLCGFNLNNIVNKEGRLIQKGLFSDNPYYQYETLITDNYSIISPEYKEWLLKYEELDINPNEPYIRKWCAPIDKYMLLYKDIDVLIAPLTPCEFNNCKSNLKFLEAGITHTAIIATNTGPYAEFGKDLLNDPIHGNCRLVKPDWIEWMLAIQQFVLNPELIKISSDNLYKDVLKYNLNEITKQRAMIYKQIINNKNE